MSVVDLQMLEAIKNVAVSFNLTDETNFSSNIYVPFLPDAMIVKSINYLAVADDASNAYLIYSDIVADYIGSFSVAEVDPTPHMLGVAPAQSLIFPLSKPINGTYNFKFQTAAKVDIAAGDLAGAIVIQLEFVKLKKK